HPRADAVRAPRGAGVPPRRGGRGGRRPVGRRPHRGLREALPVAARERLRPRGRARLRAACTRETAMSDFARIATDLLQLGSKIPGLYTDRVLTAQNASLSSARTAVEAVSAPPAAEPGGVGTAWAHYATDWFQRWVLFWDTLRQRGNNFLEHERAGK